MHTRALHRAMNVAVLIGALAACAPNTSTSSPANDLQVVYPLLVNNRSDFEVVVYAMASPTTRGIRLGSARAMGTTYMKIPVYAMQSQDIFAVQLHAIGAVRSVPNWISEATLLSENLMAQLDILGDN